MKKLYEYQKSTVDKFYGQRIGLEASDMGTGKTIVAIELASKWKNDVLANTGKNLPILVVAPLNTFPSWQDKLAEQKPDWSVYLLNRKDRNEFVELMNSDNCPDVLVCHYEALRLIPFNAKNIFSVIVADEVHKIASRNILQTKRLKELKTYNKLGLSGTASADKPWNIWSILHWLNKKEFSSYWRFIEEYVIYEKKTITQNGKITSYKQFLGVKNEKSLHKRIERFYVRHLKDEKCCSDHPNGVMPYLPPVVRKKITVELSGLQLKLYRQMENNMVAWLGEDEDEPMIAPVVLTKLQRLNQIALATPTMDDDGIVGLSLPSPKYAALRELILDYGDKKFLVFTSSKLMANLVYKELTKEGVSCGLITGDTKESERMNLVSNFSGGKYRVIIGTIRSISEGIDGLQDCCSTAVFLDRDLSTIKNKQAEDRLHRNGQDNPVTIIDIVASNAGIDQSNLSRLGRKWRQIKKFLDVR